jgi:hypothetical protein
MIIPYCASVRQKLPGPLQVLLDIAINNRKTSPPGVINGHAQQFYG